MKKVILNQVTKIAFSSLLITLILTVPYFSNYFIAQQVLSASLTSAKVTISDSRASLTGVTHTFQFTTATSEAIKYVDFTYCTTASGNCSAVSGLVLTSGTGSITGIGAGTVSSPSANSLRYTVAAPSIIGSGTQVTIPFTNITNPTGPNTSFFVRVQTRLADEEVVDNVSVASAVLTSSSIAVTASVGAAFTFTVAGVVSGSGPVNQQTTNITTTQNSIPFGDLSADTPNTGAHDVTVVTNSPLGYVVTVRSATNPPLNDGSNNIDSWSGTNANPSLWDDNSGPAGSTPNENTGYFGYTTEDATLSTGTVDRFTSSSGNKWAGLSTTAEEIIYKNSSTLSSGEKVRIGWRVEVNNNQPAGNYSGTVILVATPTY